MIPIAKVEGPGSRLIRQQDNKQKQVKQIHLSSETLLTLYNAYFGLYICPHECVVRQYSQWNNDLYN
jgi:hypothetical protein